MRNNLINLKKVSKSNIYIFVIFGISFLLMSFTLFDKIAWGNDYPFHIANIMSLDNNIKPSIFDFVFSKITNIAGYGLGYGTYIFYPVLSHLFTAYIFIFTKIVGLNLPQTMELVKMLVLFLSGLSMFFLAKKISNSKEVGLISAIIATALTFHQFLPIIYTIIGYVIVQVIESMIVTPKIVGDSLGISPVVVIVGLMIGGALGGFIGMIIALPIAAFIKILIDTYIFKKPLPVINKHKQNHTTKEENKEKHT